MSDYKIIACSDCAWVWVVRTDGAESATCPECKTEYEKSKRKALATADTHEEAAEKRGQLLRERWSN